LLKITFQTKIDDEKTQRLVLLLLKSYFDYFLKLEKNSNDVLKEGLDSLSGVCDVLNDRFDAAMKKFEK